MTIQKNRFLFVLLILLSLFFLKELFFGFGYVESYFSMVYSNNDFNPLLYGIVLIPSILYLILAFISILNPKLLSDYLIIDLEKIITEDSIVGKLEFTFLIVGLLLLAIALPIITSSVFTWTVIGLEDLLFSLKNSIELLNLTYILVSFMLFAFGILLIRYKLTLAQYLKSS